MSEYSMNKKCENCHEIVAFLCTMSIMLGDLVDGRKTPEDAKQEYIKFMSMMNLRNSVQPDKIIS